MQQDRDFTADDREKINPGNALSINTALDFVKNPVKCCEHVQDLIQRLMNIVRVKKDDAKTKGGSTQYKEFLITILSLFFIEFSIFEYM